MKVDWAELTRMRDWFAWNRPFVPKEGSLKHVLAQYPHVLVHPDDLKKLTEEPK